MPHLDQLAGTPAHQPSAILNPDRCDRHRFRWPVTAVRDEAQDPGWPQAHGQADARPWGTGRRRRHWTANGTTPSQPTRHIKRSAAP